MEETQEHLEAHTEAVVKSMLHIQEDHRKDASRPSQEKHDEPMQAGQRDIRVHFPEQHLKKPGLEAELDVKPMYDAPAGVQRVRQAAGHGGAHHRRRFRNGRAVAVLYAREGADIAIVYLNEHEDAEETKRAVEAEGRRCIVMAGDVAHRGFCRQAVEMTVAEFGKLDILVNNAAFQEHVEDFLDLTEEHFNRTLKTNLYGFFNMAQAAVPHIKPKGSIVMTGSVTGASGEQRPARLRDDEGRHPCFCAVAFDASHSARHSRECGRAGAGMDAAEPGRQIRRPRPELRQRHHGWKRAARAGGNRAGLCVPRSAIHVSYITGEIIPILGGYAGG